MGKPSLSPSHDGPQPNLRRSNLECADMSALWKAATCRRTPKSVASFGIPVFHHDMKRFLILQVFGALLIGMAHGATNFDLAAKATNDLAVDLHRQLATGNENLCISPYSIETALAMTFAGADGETRTEMARVLHLTDDRAVPASFALLQNSLEQMSAKTAEQVKQSKKSGGPSEPITLNFANRLFAQKGYAFRPAFLMHLTHNYGAAFEP